MTNDTWTRMLIAVCRNCHTYRGCDIYNTIPICEGCWKHRRDVAAKARSNGTKAAR